MNDYEGFRFSNEQSAHSRRSLSSEALRASWSEIDIPDDLVEQTVSLLKSRQEPVHLSEIIFAVFKTPGIGRYSFQELRNQLNSACENGILLNLPHGKYAYPTLNFTPSSSKSLTNRIRQAGINPSPARSSHSVGNKTKR